MNIEQAREFLLSHDNYTILTHKNPDGDTLGCGFGLCGALRRLGKRANVINEAPISKRYDFMYEWYEPQEFEEQCVVAVDIADVKLMGAGLAEYQQPGKVDLCIDHHLSNKSYAKNTVLDSTAGAAAMIIYEILKDIDGAIGLNEAVCLYTGIATDTGCFKYNATDARAHRYAAALIEMGVEVYPINRKMFELKSKNVVAAERAIVSEMKFFLGDRVAVNVITLSTLSRFNIVLDEIEHISSYPLTIEGVAAGVTVKEKDTGVYKISLRTTDELNASEICQQFGGGGHIRASGCEIKGELYEVIEKIINVISQYLNKSE